MVIIASILFLYGKLLFKRSKRILKQEVLRVFVSYSDAFKVMKGLIAYTNNVLYMFCEALGFEYDPRQLADKLLDLDPDNEFAVKYKYHTF